MDVGTIVSLIGSLGFPIVMCLIILKMMSDNNKTHKEEINKMTDALEHNTQALIELKDKLNG